MSIHDRPPIVPDQVPQTPEDRTQARRTIEHSTRENLPWHQKRLVRVGGAVAGLIAAGGSIIGLTSGESEEPSRPQTTTSTPADVDRTPSNTPPPSPEVTPSIPATPQEAVGVKLIDYDNLNLHTDDPVYIERVKTPLPASDYTPEEFVQEMGKKINVLLLSGRWDTDANGGGGDQTNASKLQQDELLTAIFPNNEVAGAGQDKFDGFRNMRSDLSGLLNYYDNGASLGANDTYTNSETGNTEYATAHFSYNPRKTKKEGDTYLVTTEVRYDTNLRFINGDDIMESSQVNDPAVFEQTIIIRVGVDGNWENVDIIGANDQE